MLGFIGRRLLGMLAVLAVVAVGVFVIARVMPGDPGTILVGDNASPAAAAEMRARLGLDAALPVQFVIWLGNLARGDLGDSIFLGQPVLSLLAQRAEPTVALTLMALALAIAIALPAGIVAAVWRDTLVDRAILTFAMLGASIPSFWLGLLFISWFAVGQGWFPVSGYGPPEADFLGRLRFLMLPAIVLGLVNAALISRFTRSAMLDVLHEDFILTCRAKGLPGLTVVMKHALRSAFIPILTVVGLAIALLLGGAIVTETVFALPGLGNLVVSAVLRRDYPVIQGALLVIATVYVLVNLAIDLLYAIVDPRVRLR
jgi:peptide/nickel transport system permease protein